jgi:hypothetical protein
MTSGELEERIIEFIDVLDVEECDDYAVDFDIENIEAI